MNKSLFYTMLTGKQFITVFALTILVAAGMAATHLPQAKHRNLQILPQDISDQQLDSIMQSYNKALNVSCAFCHAAVPGFPDSLDYASDQNRMKENAREMLRMTIHINKTWFYFDKTRRPEYLNVVHCMTCHRGNAYPVD